MSKRICVGLILWWAIASGQAPNGTARFEVASVKFRGVEPGVSWKAPPNGKVTGVIIYRDVKLMQVVMRAYSIDSDLIVGPPWMGENRYDITARAPAGTSAEQVPAMLQNLLSERFKMRVHWEFRDRAIYALVVGKGGPKSRLPRPVRRMVRNTVVLVWNSPVQCGYLTSKRRRWTPLPSSCRT